MDASRRVPTKKRMKRLNNILSYLWGLLLLLMLTTCSDWEEIVVTMQGEEEVELTIQTNIPSLGGGTTRTAPTEDITSITALAFDSDHELIKVVIINDVSIEPSATPSTSGTYKVKVPVRTRRIHFIAKNDDNPNDETDVEFTEITDVDYGMSDEELLKDRLATELHYWGMLDFIDAAALKSGGDVTLYRNMAKVTLETDGENDYIAGFLNYNIKGTIVPYKDGVLGYQTDTNHDLPTNFDITSDEEERNLGKAHYVFEEFNDTINNNTDLVYAICNIDSKYYKIAFKSSTDYYYLIRNQVYNIKIAGALDEGLGKGTYAEAVQNGKPINDTTKEKVYISFIPDEETTFFIGTTDEGSTRVSMYLGDTGKIKVKIPEGITELQIGYSTINFDEGGVTTTTTVTKIGDTETKGNVYVDTYDLTNLGDAREIELSMTLKGSIKDAIDGLEIQFRGIEGEKQSDDKLVVDVVKQANLTVNPTTVSLPKAAGSEFAVTVTIPDYVQGDLSLHIGDIDAKYTITPPDGLVLEKGMYHVTKGMRYTFYFTLNEDGSIGDKHTINFDLYSRFFHLTGATSVTLIDDAVPDQDTYEIWVGDGNAWTGTTNSVEFFGYETTAESNGFDKVTTLPTGFRTDFYDTGANSHKSQAMLMGSDDSFTFTIPEGDNRWLTLLVANDDNDDTPSIQLSNGSDWVTVSSNDGVVPANYNFGNGEITTAGRLIRYELEPGTYTLQGSDDAAYLLYYMRVTKDKPVTTDVAQPLLTDYNLSWSGATYTNNAATGHLPIGEDNLKHIVDENNLTHTVVLKAENSLTSSLNLSTSSALAGIDLVVETTRVTFTATNENTYNKTTTKQEISAQSNSCSLTNYNAGNYSLSGTINEPDYKYDAFYDKLHLDAVQYEVKSPIMPGLYTSMDGDKLTPVNGFTSLDEAWAIGFKMPMVVPDLEVSPENYTIDISIPGWTISTDDDARGLGVEVIEQNAIYRLQKQSNSNDNNNVMYHPREGWTYKIKWASIPDAKEIEPSLTGNEASDTDHYFIYNGTIAKSVEIPTPLEIIESSLNIKLDFYADENGDGNIDNQGNSFNNLLLKLTDQTVASKVWLKATVNGDLSAYYNQKVQLQGTFDSNYQWANANGAIHWDNSRQEDNSSISYYGENHNGTGLEFEIKEGQTEYLMEWVFVTGDNYSGSGDIQFTYTLSNNQGHTITNDSDRQATFAFTNEPTNNGQILVAANGNAAANSITMPLMYGANSTEEFSVDVPVPNGVTGINISAPDYLAVSIGKVAAANEQYPGNPVAVNGNYTFTDSDKTTPPRFKFKLNGTPTNNQSVITFRDVNGQATPATITVNWTQRGAESNQTTIWSGAMDLQWTRNYLEATTNQLQAGTQVTLYFTTIGGQSGQIKLHDSSETSISGDSGFAVTNGATQYSFTLQNAVNGLKINGNNVRMTSIVVSTSAPSTEQVIFNYDFSDGNPIGGWYTTNNGNAVTKGERKVVDGVLVMTNDNSGATQGVRASLSQAAVDMPIVSGVTYTLTFDVKAEVTEDNKNFPIVFQDPDNNYDEFSTFTPEVKMTNTWQSVTLTATATKTPTNGRIVFSFGHLNGTIYIDNLKLVRNN